MNERMHALEGKHKNAAERAPAPNARMHVEEAQRTSSTTETERA